MAGDHLHRGGDGGHRPTAPGRELVRPPRPPCAAHLVRRLAPPDELAIVVCDDQVGLVASLVPVHGDELQAAIDAIGPVANPLLGPVRSVQRGWWKNHPATWGCVKPAIALIGWFNLMAPVEPRNTASPKAKMPPSEATSQ